MIKTFLSYSLNDQDEYILSLVSGQLRKKGLSISQSSDFKEKLSEFTIYDIKTSNLIIGLATRNSDDIDRVQNEWKKAIGFNIPTLLVVEEGVPIDESAFDSHIIQFSRNNPQTAIELLNDKMEKKKDDFYVDMKAVIWFFGAKVISNIINLLSHTYENKRIQDSSNVGQEILR